MTGLCGAECPDDMSGEPVKCDRPAGHQGAHSARVRLVWESLGWANDRPAA